MRVLAAFSSSETGQWRSQGVLGMCPPLGPISYIFKELSAKKLQNNTLAQPPLGLVPPPGKS